MAELENLTKSYLSKLKNEMEKLGYFGTFTFEYNPEDEKDGHFSTLYHLRHLLPRAPH